ncbi:MAG: diaminopimelate decarboxylase [Anaerolineae bacterium]
MTEDTPPSAPDRSQGNGPWPSLRLFPDGAHLDEGGRLWLGGCSAAALAGEFGTPLYVFDESTLRARCREYRRALQNHYPGPAAVSYAGKAGLNLTLARLFEAEGLGLDVVSGGELYVARRAGFPAGRIHFHGNNKSAGELGQALEAGVGRIVVDNFDELALLESLLAEGRFSRTGPAKIWLRLSPGVDAHTHAYRKTGLLDSKFGFPLSTGDAERALQRAIDSSHLEPVGIHAHIGSQIDQTDPFAAAVEKLIGFVAAVRDARSISLREVSPGGGWGVANPDRPDLPPIAAYVQALAEAVVGACRRRNLDPPLLVLEPGRSITAPAGVALYRAGARKEIPGVRTYVSVDGGLADNIRPALYGARYTALAVGKPAASPGERVTIAGKYCESGDILIRDIELPRLAPGDLLAVPMAGAYCLAMSSNYNLALRPAVVMVGNGQARLVQRRETYQDLIARDIDE